VDKMRTYIISYKKIKYSIEARNRKIAGVILDYAIKGNTLHLFAV
jgi:hypothetical protein